MSLVYKIKRYSKSIKMCLTTPWKLQPHMIRPTILEIDFQYLKNKGFKYIVFDKDNTLSDHHEPEILNEDFHKKLIEIQEIFGQENTAIYTNNFKSPGLFTNGQKFPIELIETTKKKPFGKDFITAHFNTVIRNGGKSPEYFKGEHCIVVGDRLATDIMQAHELGAFGILVEPFDLEDGEYKINPEVKYARWFEHFIWKYFTGNKIAEFNGEFYGEANDVKED